MFRITWTYRIHGLNRSTLDIDDFRYGGLTALIRGEGKTALGPYTTVRVEYEVPDPAEVPGDMTALMVDLSEPDAPRMIEAGAKSMTTVHEAHYDHRPAALTSEERQRLQILCSTDSRWPNIVTRLSEGQEELAASDHEEATRRLRALAHTCPSLYRQTTSGLVLKRS